MRLSFKDPEALRVLTKCLLHRDFGLTIELPENKLIPTIPLRLNYILFIEDFLKQFNITEVIGIDVGVGASCIYPILAASMNTEWKMLGLEIDSENIEFAIKNVETNNLKDRITVMSQQKDSKIFSQLDNDVSYSFCMCNPPFFKSLEDAFNSNNRTGHRKKPRTPITGNSNEIACDGGECEFVKGMVKESLDLRTKIKIYSAMLGHKTSLLDIIEFLKDSGVENYTTTQFCQGNTTRWGLFWSFCVDLPLGSSSQQETATVTKKNVLKHLIFGNGKPENLLTILKDTQQRIKNLLSSIKVNLKMNEESLTVVNSEITASENTWSNQRRKRREESQKLKHVAKKQRVEETNKGPADVALRVGLDLTKVDKDILLQMYFIEGSLGKDSVNQILTFIKNNLNKE